MVELLIGGPQRSGDIARALDLAHPAVSRHLKILRQAGLVEEALAEDDRRAHVYRLRRPQFSAMRGWLDEVEAFWRGQLDAFKAYAESGEGREDGAQ